MGGGRSKLNHIIRIESGTNEISLKNKTVIWGLGILKIISACFYEVFCFIKVKKSQCFCTRCPKNALEEGKTFFFFFFFFFGAFAIKIWEKSLS